jgi:O-antigen ligase
MIASIGIPGIVAVFSVVAFSITGLIEIVKKFIPGATGQEPRLALLIGLVAGISSRMTSPSEFPPGAVGWILAVVAGIVAGGLGSKAVHDFFLNPTLGKKDDK